MMHCVVSEMVGLCNQFNSPQPVPYYRYLRTTVLTYGYSKIVVIFRPNN